MGGTRFIPRGAPREKRSEDYETNPPPNAGTDGQGCGGIGGVTPLIQSAIISCASAAETGLKGVAGIDRVTSRYNAARNDRERNEYDRSHLPVTQQYRSEERRVGKECRSRW